MAIVDQINAITGVKTGGSIQDALKNLQIPEIPESDVSVADFTYVHEGTSDTFVSTRTAAEIGAACKAGRTVVLHLPKIVDDQQVAKHYETWLPVIGYTEGADGAPIFAIATGATPVLVSALNAFSVYDAIEVDGTSGKIVITLDLT